MIKNIIFDLGNVLIYYKPDKILTHAGITDPEDRELLKREIFKSKEWPQADAGEITVDELCSIVVERVPERLKETARHCVTAWFQPMDPVPGMEEFIREKKAEGIKMVVLTNAPGNVHDYFKFVPGHELIDGLVVSADIKMSKPGAEIFNYALNKYGLKAEETIFVDDLQENVDGAKAVGMDGFRFDPDTGARDLREYLRDKA